MICRKSRVVEKDSRLALKEAKAVLYQTKARSTEVTEVASSLRWIRERNHFGEQLERIMGGSR